MITTAFPWGLLSRAAELLGKELGMFVDRRHLDVSFEQRLATMTPEQRMELARDMREQVARYREIEAKRQGPKAATEPGALESDIAR